MAQGLMTTDCFYWKFFAELMPMNYSPPSILLRSRTAFSGLCFNSPPFPPLPPSCNLPLPPSCNLSLSFFYPVSFSSPSLFVTILKELLTNFIMTKIHRIVHRSLVNSLPSSLNSHFHFLSCNFLFHSLIFFG